MPSTYYYTAVHCYGRLVFQEEATLEHWLTILNERMESRFENGWKLNEVSEYDIKRRLKHILGFELQIDRIEGKYKLGQDEPKKDALAVADQLAKDSSQHELSELIHAYNIDRSEP
jgi:transcriptional regulator